MRLEARIEGLYLGDRPGVEKTPVNQLVVDFEGIFGDRHYGFTRSSDSRTPEYPRGTQIRNSRQWSAIAPEEIEEIARQMHIDRIDPAWLGVNLFLRGIPNLSQLQKGTKLEFPKDAVLLVEDQNMPCTGPGEVIASKFPEGRVNPWHFPKAAMIDKTTSRRGLVGVVERPGMIVLSDVVIVKPYEPRTYSLPPFSEQPPISKDSPSAPQVKTGEVSERSNLLAVEVVRLFESLLSGQQAVLTKLAETEGRRTTINQIMQKWQSLSPEQQVQRLPTFIKMIVGIDYLSVNETAAILGKTPDRVRQLYKEGQLPVTKDHKGRYIFASSDVAAYKSRPVGRPIKRVEIINIFKEE